MLDADAAELHGNGIKVEQHGEQSNLGFWDNAGDWASWKVDFTRPGVYKVTAQFASISGETEVALEVAGKQLVGKVTATGDWDKFADVAFGTVKIAKTRRAGSQGSSPRRQCLEGGQPRDGEVHAAEIDAGQRRRQEFS